MRETLACGPERVERFSALDRRSTSSTSGSHRLVHGRVVRRTADEALDRDS